MQGELFKMSGPITDASKLSEAQTAWMDRLRVTLRLDHLSMLGISALVLYVLVFSFGVEKGKRIALRELEAEKVKKESISKELSQGEAPMPLKEAPKEAPPTGVTTAPEVVEPVPSQGAGRYTIQVITFMSQSRAEEEVKRLKERGYQSFIIPGRRFFQVCVDTFENITEARQKLLRLKEEGFAPPDAFIRPLESGQATF